MDYIMILIKFWEELIEQIWMKMQKIKNKINKIILTKLNKLFNNKKEKIIVEKIP